MTAPVVCGLVLGASALVAFFALAMAIAELLFGADDGVLDLAPYLLPDLLPTDPDYRVFAAPRPAAPLYDPLAPLGGALS